VVTSRGLAAAVKIKKRRHTMSIKNIATHLGETLVLAPLKEQNEANFEEAAIV
jgi:hypothetical protein